MTQFNSLGLDQPKLETLATKLNILLANYSIFYQNTRGFHWNIKGKNFFELHLKFEELYTNLQLKIDEIAERILTLGFYPNHNFSDYQKTATITEIKETTKDTIAIATIIESLATLIQLQRVILKLAQEIDDEGTSSLMSDNIREQEKLIWMYKAYIS